MGLSCTSVSIYEYKSVVVCFVIMYTINNLFNQLTAPDFEDILRPDGRLKDMIECVYFSIQGCLYFKLFLINKAHTLKLLSLFMLWLEFDKNLHYYKRFTLSFSSLWILCSLTTDFLGDGDISDFIRCRGVRLTDERICI